MNGLQQYARVAQEVRVARDIQRQHPDIPWSEALRIAAKWIEEDPLTDVPRKP